MPIQPTTQAPAPQEFVNYLQRALVYGQITKKDFNPSGDGLPGSGPVSFPVFADRVTLENMARAVQFGQITADQISDPSTLNAIAGGPAPSNFVDSLRGPLVSGQFSGTDFGLTFSSPEVIPQDGLSLWLKADTGVTTSGSNVTAWADQSPSNLTFLADATTSDITLNSNYTNGKPAIIFSSASEGGSMGLSNSSVFVTKSVFIALAPNGDNFEYAVPYENNGLNIYSTSQNYGAPWGSYLNGNVNALTTLSANGTKYLLSATSDTGEDAQFYLNGANDTDSSGAGFYNERSEIVIGNGGARGSFNQQFEGAIMEIVAYNRVLTTPERQQVETYLNNKYAIY